MKWIPRSTKERIEPKEAIFRKVRGILNKLTPENFDTLLNKLTIDIATTSVDVLKGTILLVYDKAIEEHNYSFMYARLCKELDSRIPNLEVDSFHTTTFRNLLVRKCEEEFAKRTKYLQVDGSGDSTFSKDEVLLSSKAKVLGNIVFVGELFKLGMLHESVMHNCIKQLLDRKRSPLELHQNIECLCQLLRATGKKLDTPDAKGWMDKYFERMESLSHLSDLPVRLCFMLQDTIELRKRRWLLRKVYQTEVGPKPLQELRRERPTEAVKKSNKEHKRNWQAHKGPQRSAAYVEHDEGFGGPVGGSKGQQRITDLTDDSDDLVVMTTNHQSIVESSQPHNRREVSSDNWTSSAAATNTRRQVKKLLPTSRDEGLSLRPSTGGRKQGGPIDQLVTTNARNDPNPKPKSNFEIENDNGDDERYPKLPMGAYPSDPGYHGYPPPPFRDPNIPFRPRIPDSSHPFPPHPPPPRTMGPRPPGVVFDPRMDPLTSLPSGTIRPPYRPNMEMRPRMKYHGPQLQSVQSGMGINSNQPPIQPDRNQPIPIRISKNKKLSNSPAKQRKNQSLESDRIVEDILSKFLQSEDTDATIATIKATKTLSSHDLCVGLVNNSLERSENDRIKVSLLINHLIKDGLLDKSLFKSCIEVVLSSVQKGTDGAIQKRTYIAGFIARAVEKELMSLEEGALCCSQGKHHPTFLVVLQVLTVLLGREHLQQMFSSSHLNIGDVIPPSLKSSEGVVKVLEERKLDFLYPIKRLQRDLTGLFSQGTSAVGVYKWIKSEVNSSLYKNPDFISTLTTCILNHVCAESTAGKGELSASAKANEKSLFQEYKVLIEKYVQDIKNLQLTVVYTTQVFCCTREYPKGMLLRLFSYYYEMDVIEEEVFHTWKEDITQEHPGKEKALFQVNQWLNLLAEAVTSEDDNDEDNDSDSNDNSNED